MWWARQYSIGLLGGRAGVFATMALLLIGGCASRKPPAAPFAAPQVELSVDHFMGSPLSGPVVVKALPASDLPGALDVRVTLVALERAGREALSSLTSSSRLIVVTRSGVPVRASSRLVQAAGIADGDVGAGLRGRIEETGTSAFGRTAVIGALRAATPPGATARMIVAEPTEVVNGLGRPARRHIELMFHRVDEKSPLQVAVVMEDLLAPPAPIIDTTPNEKKTEGDRTDKAAPEPATPSEPPAPLREMVVLDRPAFADHDSFVLMLPFQFDKTGGQVVAALVDLDLGGAADAAKAELYAKCMADLRSASALAATRPYLEPLDSPEWPGLSAALDSMGAPGTPRQAMVFLGVSTGVEVFEDFALVADDDLRRALAAKIYAKLGAPSQVRTKAALAWVLENATFELFSERSASATLPEELSAVLARHAGEAGRHPGALDDALKTAKNENEFNLRLIAENYIYLEDSSPASRVRAFDWLQARGQAPATYDPLAPPKLRRAALEKALTPAGGGAAGNTAAAGAAAGTGAKGAP